MGLLPCVMSTSAPEHPRKRSIKSDRAIANIGCKTRIDDGQWAMKYPVIYGGRSNFRRCAPDINANSFAAESQTAFITSLLCGA